MNFFRRRFRFTLRRLVRSAVRQVAPLLSLSLAAQVAGPRTLGINEGAALRRAQSYFWSVELAPGVVARSRTIEAEKRKTAALAHNPPVTRMR